MALDPNKLSRNELVQLLNSTALGESITRSRLDRQMNRAGRRWHDGRHVRLVDYLRWLVREVERPAKPRIDGRAADLARKNTETWRSQNVAPVPDVVERHGWNWYIPNVSRSSEFRHVAFDANSWKSFVHGRLATLAGDKGAMTLFGKKPEQHRLFAEHVADAESYVVTAGQGRTVHEWRPKPSKPDNHWFDCLVGCAVAASMAGVKAPGEAAAGRQRKRYTQTDLTRR